MKTFGQRVRTARLQRGWTQNELAKASGLTQSAIGNYEKGWRTDPTSAALLKLASALNVTPEWLQQGSQQGRNTPSLQTTDPRTHVQTRPWPFTRIQPKEIEALSTVEKQLLEALIETFIQNCRSPR